MGVRIVPHGRKKAVTFGIWMKDEINLSHVNLKKIFIFIMKCVINSSHACRCAFAFDIILSSHSSQETVCSSYQ